MHFSSAVRQGLIAASKPDDPDEAKDWELSVQTYVDGETKFKGNEVWWVGKNCMHRFKIGVQS